MSEKTENGEIVASGSSGSSGSRSSSSSSCSSGSSGSRSSSSSRSSSDSSDKSRYPLTPDHLFVVTELAKLGMAYLGLVLPEFAKEQENAGKDKRDHYAHLKSIYEVAGPETVRHFDEMCQYMWEEGQRKGQRREVKGQRSEVKGQSGGVINPYRLSSALV